MYCGKDQMYFKIERKIERCNNFAQVGLYKQFFILNKKRNRNQKNLHLSYEFNNNKSNCILFHKS